MIKRSKLLNPSRQLAFHELLVAARHRWLRDALSIALKKANPENIKREITRLAPRSAQSTLAAAGIRDEFVFPTPHILEIAPSLLGYYRLLLGLPQKTFYGAECGMGMFKSMESAGSINEKQLAQLPLLCKLMSEALGELVMKISPTISDVDIYDLPLLTLGSQFQGGNNNIIGKQVTRDVFLLLVEILKNHIVEQTRTGITVKNEAGRIVKVQLSSDPDIVIIEETPKKVIRKIAIEIKGGTDQSNAHNRAGEAEKSHQKARLKGFKSCWTIITKKGLDMKKLKSESPTTEKWFDTSEFLGGKGDDFLSFKKSFMREVNR